MKRQSDIRRGKRTGTFTLFLLLMLLLSISSSTRTSQSKYALKGGETIQLSAGVWLNTVNISGSAVAGQTLTSALSPAGVPATWRWLQTTEAAFVPGVTAYTAIAGAASASYTAGMGDLGKYLVLEATDSSVAGLVRYSNALGPVTTPLVSVSIKGNAMVGSTLELNDLQPAGASADYEWLRSQSPVPDSTYSPIAVGTSYTLQPSDIGYYFMLRAAGSGSYTGTVNSQPSAQVTAPETAGVQIRYTKTGNNLRLEAIVTAPGPGSLTYEWFEMKKINDPWASRWTGTPVELSGAFWQQRYAYRAVVRLDGIVIGEQTVTVAGMLAGGSTGTVGP